MIRPLPNIRHLAAFVATVQCGSVTKAARKVHLTQSALSQAIANLEATLDCQLFDREPEGMRPTEPARLLVSRAEAALKSIGSPRITSTQIRAFLALAKAGSYASAGELIGMSPPALHRAVRDLSLSLGETLVERRGRYLSLTLRGEARARAFGLAMAEIRNGYDEIGAWQGRAAGRIVIGAMPLSRARWLPSAVLEFSRSFPDVSVAVIEGSFQELAPMLREGELDFVLGALRDESGMEDLEQRALFEDRPQITMRIGHPLAGVESMTLQDLIAYPWVVPAPRTPLRGFWEELFLQGEQPLPAVAIECSSVLATRELLIRSDMLSLLSPDQIALEIDAGLLAVRPPPYLVSRVIGITTRGSWRPTPIQREMLSKLELTAAVYS